MEATKMAEHARTLIKANNLQHLVEVIEGSMEDITLPEKVDVIISEWMGYFLLRESMFDSVICARDCWLKPTGVMHAIVEELAEFGATVHICSRNQLDIDKCLKEWRSKGFCVTRSVCDVI
ncbi:protein arginine N-methyltransferase PRMT10-like [Prosopis cineraria]|uniref:protein arginine N-methyltransferase PRMT10-like n=1 Tax=Prosopis cineraria TaxID=364024 RepID=UPI00240EB590|nr:protein arginine N-methyltransferase PRMT10-like [Prosopis cineraria]